MDIADYKRVLVTTFDGSGTATASPENVVQLDDTRIGCWMPDITGWDARLVQSNVVTLQACNSGGKPNREEPLFEGHAELELDGAVFDEVRAKTFEKYGFGATLESWVDKAREFGGDKTPEGAIVIKIVG